MASLPARELPGDHYQKSIAAEKIVASTKHTSLRKNKNLSFTVLCIVRGRKGSCAVLQEFDSNDPLNLVDGVGLRRHLPSWTEKRIPCDNDV